MNIADEYEKFRRNTAETHVGDSIEQRVAFWEGCKAGMLAAADIAERMYFHHTPDDGVISGEGVAAEIRKRVNDI